MRLSNDQVQAIRNAVQRVLGAGARISVFGSMALDSEMLFGVVDAIGAEAASAGLPGQSQARNMTLAPVK